MVRVMTRKLVGILLYLAYYNIFLLIFASGIYLNIITLTIIALDQFLAMADALIRPSIQREDIEATTRLVGLLLLLHPLIISVLFYENLILTSVFLINLNSIIISYLGIIVYIIGGAIVIASRTQLGRYGDGTTELKDDHKLLTKGIYSHIRHPLYSGGIISRIGFGLTFRAFIGVFLFPFLYFIVFRKRMDIEEESLALAFGEEYENYKKRTKRLLPFIY